jgi:hypothetical protein
LKIIKEFFKISYNAFVFLSVVSFVFLLLCISAYEEVKELDEIYIGIPYTFYHFYPAVDLDGIDYKYTRYLNWKFLLHNYLIFWIITFAYFQLKKIYYNYFSAKLKQKKQIN